MANLNELNLNDDDVIEVDFENLPPQMGGGFEPPQPGTYKFQLPADLNDVFEVVATERGPRIKAVLKDHKELTGFKGDGSRFNLQYNFSNEERNRGDHGAASEMSYLLAAVNSIPATGKNKAYAEALIAAAGRTFVADVELSTTCGKNRDVYMDGKVVIGKKGCGQSFAQDSYTTKSGPNAGKITAAIPRDAEDPSKFSVRFKCVCGAELRAWPRLTRYRPFGG